MTAESEIKNLEGLKYFLSNEMARLARGILLSQRKYMFKKILRCLKSISGKGIMHVLRK
jgi:hypothetical protein